VFTLEALSLFIFAVSIGKVIHIHSTGSVCFCYGAPVITAAFLVKPLGLNVTELMMVIYALLTLTVLLLYPLALDAFAVLLLSLFY